MMDKFGVPKAFILLVKMFLQDASAFVSFNSKMTKSFSISRGVRQGCPLAPYLFLLVGEALNMAAKEELAADRIQGITLSDSEVQQLLSHFADDTNFLILGKEDVLKNIVSLLQRFDKATGLLINWPKSIGF